MEKHEHPQSAESPRPLQFGLGFLFYATAVFAVVSLIFRFAFAAPSWLWLSYLFAGYLAAITIYVAFRIPVLVRRHWQRQRAILARREALAELVRQSREPAPPAAADDRPTAGGEHSV